MARIVECPKCGADISDTYQGPEPDVGIMMGGWFCDACNVTVADEDGPEPHDDDVMLSGTGASSHRCACGGNYEMGYGLAGGGGIGPYMYCGQCGAIAHKSTDPEMR